MAEVCPRGHEIHSSRDVDTCCIKCMDDLQELERSRDRWKRGYAAKEAEVGRLWTIISAVVAELQSELDGRNG